MTALATIEPNRRLSVPAAASYRRAIAAGLPRGDVNSAFRTRAEQQRLYELHKAGKGPQAAKPGYSKHEAGLALDLSNDTDDGGAARAWMQAHGANFGWVRTNDEPWHFEYQIGKDKKLKALKAAQAKADARAKVRKIQKILGVTTDGDPGPITEGAWDKLVKEAR